MPEPRQLQFESLEDVALEVDRIMDGYASAGAWNLSQTCGHLEQWMTFPMDGFPKSPFLIGVFLWCLKVTVGKSQLRQILARGFKPGMPTMPETVLAADAVIELDAVESLKDTMARFHTFEGAIYPSPLFGEMDHPTAMQLQLRHCAHHLGFLVPKE